jgi:MSHA biogenesis protein MshM
MYYSHFGLNQPPFKITPNTEFFFSGGNRGPVLEALIYAISQGEGIIKVTGEVGSGKTMLCHMLQTRLPAHVETVYIANPSVSPEEILHAIAFELQLGVARDASRLEVMQALHDYLLGRHAEGKRVVVFVEESQSMPLPSLEEIRLLSNLETKNDKLLQIVLFGQPELDQNLRKNNIRQLRERITHSFRLEPLSVDDTREYLMFRMRAAGYHGPALFSEPVVKAVARAAQGLSRRVNLIADKALLAAFSENTHTIRRKHVDAAVADSEFSAAPSPGTGLRPFWGFALLAIGVAVGAAFYSGFREALIGTPSPVATGNRAARVEKKAEPRVESAAPAARSAPANPAPTAVSSADQAVAALAAEEKKAAQKSPSISAATGTASRAVPKTAASAAAEEKPALQPPTVSVPDKTAITAAAEPTTQAPAPKTATVSAPKTVSPAPATSPKAKVTPTIEPAQAKPIDSKDLLEARVAATSEWLANEAPNTFTIQLLGTNEPLFLRPHLNDLAKVIEINKVFVYRTQAKQKPWLTVLYGSFNSYRAAQEALDKLPESLKGNRPFLRTVAGIRGEISRQAAS